MEEIVDPQFALKVVAKGKISSPWRFAVNVKLLAAPRRLILEQGRAVRGIGGVAGIFVDIALIVAFVVLRLRSKFGSNAPK